MSVNVHDECIESFCLWPLHPGPCRGTQMRRNPRMAPGASHGRARVPAQPAKAQPPAQRPAAGRARVGAPPPSQQGPARGTARPPAPAKKAAKKAQPPAGNPERRAERARESNAGGAVLMLMGASSSVNGNRFADTVMADIRMAQQRDRRDGGTANYDAALGRAAGQMARVLANERGGAPAERRHLENRIKRIAEEAMRSGDVGQLTALKRELARSRTASAAPRADILALYGLQLGFDANLWGDDAPTFASSPLGSLAHIDCNLSVFCRNPLHPGPCKGWKKMLGKVAPGTLKLIEEERKKKLAAKQAAKAKAQAAAKKVVDQAKRGEEVDAHPAAKKKLAAKAAAQILGEDEEKVTAIEGKTKLSKKEIAWHAQKKAAALLAMNLAAGNLKGSKAAQAKYRAYVRKAITEALEKDNETGSTGPDSEYQKRLNVLTRALALEHASQHTGGDGGDESSTLEAAVADAFAAAMQDDLASQKPGVPHPKLKALQKALSAIPGKPGEAEHDKAVAEAVGLDGWEPSPDAPKALPEGALSNEDADKLSKGAEQVALLTSTPEQAANGAANAKKLAQMEGFTDKQSAMVAKTASNQAAAAALQNNQGLDGFSPQGKKKFEKLLAAEMVEMMETGGGPKAGGLAELVAMKKSGAISDADFHEQVMKKLKIKSKKLNPDGSPKANAAPKPVPSSPAAGGAGAGGSTAMASGHTLDAVQDAIYNGILPAGAENAGKNLANVLDAPDIPDSVKAEFVDAAVNQQADALMSGLPTQSLNADEKAALKEAVSSVIKNAVNNPGAGQAPEAAAVAIVKKLKSFNGPQTKAFAGALVPSVKKDAASAPSSSGAKKAAFKSVASKIDATLGTDPDVADEEADIIADQLEITDDEDVFLDNHAAYLAGQAVLAGNATSLPPHVVDKLKAKAKAAFKKALTTGDEEDEKAALKIAMQMKNLGPDQLTHEADEADPATAAVNAVNNSPDAPLATKADPVDQAVHIAANLQKAYEKLTGDDGSALASSGAVKALADSIEKGETPEAKTKAAAYALAKKIVAAKIAGKSGIPPLHEQALVNELALEIEAGVLSGTMDGEFIKSLSSTKGGFTKIKIKAKQAYAKNGGLTPAGVAGPKSSSPTLPTSSKDAALDKALDDAFGDPSAPTMPNEVEDGLIDHVAQMKGVPQDLQAKLNKLADEYNAASPSEKPAIADTLAHELAATALGNAMHQTGLLGNKWLDEDGVKTVIGKHLDQMKADYLAAIQGGAMVPGGMSAHIKAAIDHTNQLGDKNATENGFDPDGIANSFYKFQTLSAMLDLSANSNAAAPAVTSPGGGAGAGGTGTGVKPVTTPAAPKIGPAGTGTQKPKVNVSALPKGTATYTAPTAPPPPATPTAKALKKPKKAAPLKPLPPAGPPPDLAQAKKVGGQGGSNPGGMYEAADGKKFYVKQQKSAAHARNEAMASALYRMAGVDTPPVHYQEGSVGELNGSLTASEIIEPTTEFDPQDKKHVAAVRRGFAIDAWLGNWDVAGLSMDNIVIDANGNPHRIGLDGSMEFRAQGSPKGAAFGDTVGEIDTLRDPSINPSAAKIFGGMTDDELIDSLSQMEAITPDMIRNTVATQGGDSALADKLIARRQDMLNRLKKLREAKEYAEKNTGPLGVPDIATDAGKIKLGGEPKKQLILKPKPPSKVAQVVLEGHEGEVYEYNERVANSRDWTGGAQDVPVQMGTIPKTSPGYTSLLNYTSSSGCNQINGHLRAGGQPSANPGTSTSSAADRVAQLDATFENARLSEPITVLRGIRGNADIFGDLWTQHRDRNWAGAEVRDLAYSSSTVNPGTACAFAGCGSPDAVVFRVHMPAGTRAINLGGNSQFPGEAEILLNRGARFRIVADNGYQDGARQLDVEVICDGDGCADTA